MTLRGTFRDGVIVPERSANLRNGDVVEIVRARAARAAKPAAARKASKPRPVAGFGSWKHRDDIGQAAGYAQRLRRRTSRGRRDA